MVEKRRLACQGVVLDQLLASKGMPGFADGSDLWSRPGIAGHLPLADGGEKPRPEGASNPGPPDKKSTVNSMLAGLFSTPLARS